MKCQRRKLSQSNRNLISIFGLHQTTADSKRTKTHKTKSESVMTSVYIGINAETGRERWKWIPNDTPELDEDLILTDSDEEFEEEVARVEDDLPLVPVKEQRDICGLNHDVMTLLGEFVVAERERIIKETIGYWTNLRDESHFRYNGLDDVRFEIMTIEMVLYKRSLKYTTDDGYWYDRYAEGKFASIQPSKLKYKYIKKAVKDMRFRGYNRAFRFHQ